MSDNNIVPFQEWRPVYEADKAIKLAKPMTATAYTPRGETPPDLDWFRLDKQRINSELSSIFTKIVDCMLGARPQDLELADLHHAVDTVKQVPLDKIRTVGIVGQQAMGKSLLINALLHRRNLSKTSAAGGACTASAIKYVHKPNEDDFGEVYDAVVQFMDDTELDEIISEHARRYYHFHFSMKVDSGYRDEEERAAYTAETFFALLWNAHNDERAGQELSNLLTAERIREGDLLRRALKMAHQRIHDSGADDKRTKHFLNMEAAALMEETQGFIAQHETLPSLWPIVAHVSISMGSALLKNAISIVDLPGLGDLNHSRTAATNSIRRKADFEIIVAKSDRVMTEEVVDAQIKQSIRTHGAKNTILVLTKIDEFFLDNHSVESIIETDDKHPFPAVKAMMTTLETALNKAEMKISRALEEDEDADCQEIVNETGALSAYGEYLKKIAQCAFVKQRAQSLEAQMRYKYKDMDPNPIRIFSVSSSLYLDWMKKRRREDPILSPEMTGIPKLRQFLLGISADDNVKAYRRHMESALPRVLGKISRIVDQENKNDAYAEIRPIFRQVVDGLRDAQRSVFSSFVEDKTIRMWSTAAAKSDALNNVKKVVEDWGENTRWNTYNKFLREMGIWKRSASKKYRGREVNWNQELSEALNPDIVAWRDHMKGETRSIAKLLVRTTKVACKDVTKFITNSSLSKGLKAFVLAEWNLRQVKVLKMSKKWDSVLKSSINDTYEYANTETDTRCMISSINALSYTEVSEMDREDSWFRKQRDKMVAAMTPATSNLLDKISAHVDTKMKNNFVDAFNKFTHEVINELSTFDEHMGDRVPPEYELTPSDMMIRSKLAVLLPELEAQVKALSALVPEKQKVKRESDFEPDDFDIQLEESPLKRRFRKV